MKEYKKSYKGLILWLIIFCILYFSVIFLPELNTRLTTAVMDNIMTISIFILTYIIYKTESVYWYNGTSFEDALEAGSERRKKFAFEHMKRFGIFALVYFIYSLISLALKIPYGFDIFAAAAGLIAAAFSTNKIKL